MSLHRYNPKRDKTEAGIIAALRLAGYRVSQLSGKGIPDLAVLAGTTVLFIECKTGKAKPTDAQAMWASAGWPVYLARTPEQALLAVNHARGIKNAATDSVEAQVMF